MTAAAVSYTPQQVADSTGMTLARVMRLIRSRQLPAHTLGGRGYLVLRDDLEKFVRNLPLA